MPTSTKILDHIVHLTPVGSLEETKQQWKDLGFTVLTGGQHADGFTENALVIFSDLVYIELITFIHPPEYYIPGSPLYLKRIGQPWANKPPGWVSYAFGGDVHADPSIAKLVNTRLKDAGSAFSYDGPKDGGRTRPDGIVLKWELTVPSRWQELVNGMGLPFYCADVTPRGQRVPSDKEYQSHANAAKSIAFLRLLVPRDAFADASKALQAIIGDAPTTSSADDSSAEWTLSAPGPGPLPKLVLSTPKDDEEEAYVKEYGLALFEVGFLVGEGGKSGQTSTPFGRVTWVVGDT